MRRIRRRKNFLKNKLTFVRIIKNLYFATLLTFQINVNRLLAHNNPVGSPTGFFLLYFIVYYNIYSPDIKKPGTIYSRVVGVDPVGSGKPPTLPIVTGMP